MTLEAAIFVVILVLTNWKEQSRRVCCLLSSRTVLCTLMNSISVRSIGAA